MFGLNAGNPLLILALFIFFTNLNAQIAGAPVRVRLISTLGTGQPVTFGFTGSRGEIKVTLKDKVQIWDAETGKLLRTETMESAAPPPGYDSIWFGRGKKFQLFRLKKASGEMQSRIVVWDR